MYLFLRGSEIWTALISGVSLFTWQWDINRSYLRCVSLYVAVRYEPLLSPVCLFLRGSETWTPLISGVSFCMAVRYEPLLSPVCLFLRRSEIWTAVISGVSLYVAVRWEPLISPVCLSLCGSEIGTACISGVSPFKWQNVQNLRFSLLWVCVVTPCSFGDVYRRFRWNCCRHYQFSIASHKTGVFIVTYIRVRHMHNVCFSCIFQLHWLKN